VPECQKRKGPGRPAGRPSKKQDKYIDALMEAIATGAPYTICCAACGIHYDTFMTWKRTDPVFAAKVEQVASRAALRLLSKIEKHADDNFAASAWILERRFPQDFSRPEVQLNLIQQNNVTNDHLTIVISAEEARQLNAEGEESRAKVREMFEEYHLRRSNGGQDASTSVSMSVQQKFANYLPDSGKGVNRSA